MKKSAAQFAQEASEIIRAAEDEGRNLTPTEQGEIDGLLELAAERKGSEDMKAQVEETMRKFGGGGDVRSVSDDAFGGLGDQFVKSANYKSLMTRGLGSGVWSTGEVELEQKATL